MSTSDVQQWLRKVDGGTVKSQSSPPPISSSPISLLSTLPSIMTPSDVCQESFVDRGSPLASYLQATENLPTVEECYNDLHIPRSLDAVDEADRVTLAYACEVHNVLQAELVLAERHYRKMLFATKAQQLRVETAREQLDTVKNQVNCGFRIALEAVAADQGHAIVGSQPSDNNSVQTQDCEPVRRTRARVSSRPASLRLRGPRTASLLSLDERT